MKKLALVLALVPGLAFSAQNAPARAGASQAGSDDPARLGQMQKRMRLARTLGLAEALDLDDAGAMRVRDVLARFDERRAPLRKQARDSARVLRDAARGDKDALPQVDSALQRLRDARNQLHNLNTEIFQQLTQGLTPEKKARAALFLSRFHEREQRIFIRGPGGHGHGSHGRGGGRGMMGAGPGEPAPGPMMEHHAMTIGDGPDLDMEEWFEEE